MKKIFISLLALLLAVVPLAGCTPQATSVSLDVIAPWSTDSGYEKSTYSIERTINEGDKKTVIANGTFTLTIEKAETVNTIERTKLTTEFSLTYLDIADAGLSRGLTDTIKSSVVFHSVGMFPVSSEKTVTIAPRKDEKVNSSYTLSVDYNALKTVRTFRDKETTVTMKKATEIFDNESVYYVVRALSGLKKSGSATFPLYNAFDSAQSGEYSTYTMSASVGENLESRELGAWAKEYGLAETDKGTKVDCLKTTLTLSATLSGTSTTLYYSDQPFIIEKAATEEAEDKTTKKVLVGLSTLEYDTGNVTRTYVNNYVLTGYSVKAE